MLPASASARRWPSPSACAARSPDTFRDFPVPISVSVGHRRAARGTPTPEALVRAANRALFAAKRLGRDRCVVHHAETLGDARRARARRPRAASSSPPRCSWPRRSTCATSRTARHSETVGRYAELIARELGLEPDQVERVRVAGVLHDIGKLGISDAILLKPGPLDAARVGGDMRHPELGARILEHANLRDVAGWVARPPRAPRRPRLPARRSPATRSRSRRRILAVADAYEAMTADRPYRAAAHAGGGARPSCAAAPARSSTRTWSPRSSACSTPSASRR